jgi:hypothetical protein
MEKLEELKPKKFKNSEELKPTTKKRDDIVFDKLFPEDKKKKKVNNFLYNKLDLTF